MVSCEFSNQLFISKCQPHTLSETTLHEYRAGRQVNLEVEVDLVARYLERLLLGESAALPGSQGQITRELLESCGFARD